MTAEHTDLAARCKKAALQSRHAKKSLREMTDEETVGCFLDDNCLDHLLEQETAKHKGAAPAAHQGGIIFNRPPADPNAPPKSRPLLDAIKKFVTDTFGTLAATYGPQLIAAIGPLLKQLLESWTKGPVAAFVDAGFHVATPESQPVRTGDKPRTGDKVAAREGESGFEAAQREGAAEPDLKETPYDPPGHDQQKIHGEHGEVHDARDAHSSHHKPHDKK